MFCQEGSGACQHPNLLETKAELVLSSPLDVTKDPVHA